MYLDLKQELTGCRHVSLTACHLVTTKIFKANFACIMYVTACRMFQYWQTMLTLTKENWRKTKRHCFSAVLPEVQQGMICFVLFNYSHSCLVSLSVNV